MIVTSKTLPEFVARSDALGGPGNPACDNYWQDFDFRPDFVVDQSLDPFGEPYVEQQLRLHAEMSGRPFDQLTNEHTPIDVATHVAAVNPYNHPSPGGLALHIERLSRAIRLGDAPRGAAMLDMGCGWGLSSEVAEYCGLDVTAVDINADFVELVNRRAERRGSRIKAYQGTFDAFDTEERFALILFYECFHHAVRPWTLLERMAGLLAPDGRVVLAGEPINAIWWKHWGLRMDALSVYCIHKFGWFESGWTPEFLMACLERAGFTPEMVFHSDPHVGTVTVGRWTGIGTTSAASIGRIWQHSGWGVEQEFLVGTGNDELVVPFPEGSSAVMLSVRNFRATPIGLRVRQGRKTVWDRRIAPGGSVIELTRKDAEGMLLFQSGTWIPDEEIGNGDLRRIGIHLEKATFR